MSADDAPREHADRRAWLCDVEAEHMVLGSILAAAHVGASVMPAVVAILPSPQAFSDEGNMGVYLTMMDLEEAGDPVDLWSVCFILNDFGRLDTAVWAPALAHFAAEAITHMHAEYYASHVADLWARRRGLAATAAGNALLTNPTIPFSEALARTQTAVLEAGEGMARAGIARSRDLISRLLDRLDEGPDRARGIDTGLIDVTRITNGLQPSDLIVLAGLTSSGKTSLALKIVHHVAVVQGKRVLIFSLEMSGEQLSQRLMALDSGVELAKIRTATLNEDEWGHIINAGQRCAEAPWDVVEDTTMGGAALAAFAREEHRREPVALVVVDYIQLIPGAGHSNRASEIADITRSLKGLAGSINAPVLCLSQFSRAATARTSNRPVLSDLKDGSSIEQAADVVLFVHRESQFDDTVDPRTATIIVEKQRNGSRGDVEVQWDAERATFNDLAFKSDQAYYAS